MTVLQKLVERFFQLRVESLVEPPVDSDQPGFAMGEFLLPDTHRASLFSVELFYHDELVAQTSVGREMDFVHQTADKVQPQSANAQLAG